MIAPPSRSSGSTEKNPSTTLAVAPVKPKRSPEEEIALRKARRRLSKWLAIAVVVVVSAGLLSAGGVYLYRDYQTQQGHVAVLDDALLLVKEAGETIEKLDEVAATLLLMEAMNSVLISKRSSRMSKESCRMLMKKRALSRWS